MKKIMLIEDNRDLASLIERKLIGAGYEVESVENGASALSKIEEGVERIEKNLPDLILLDMTLPDMNGLEILQKIKSGEIASSIPVIIISNSGEPVEIEKANLFGVKDYLIKADFTPDEVLEKVNSQLKTEAINPGTTDFNQGSEQIAPKIINGKDMEVLLVEDDDDLRNLMIHKLSKEGLAVEGVSNGKDAFEKLNQQQPKVILLDLILPDINGFEILENLKKDEKTKNIPVVILSNLGQKSDVDKCLGLGANDYIVKSDFTPKDVIVKIEKYLSN